MISTTQAAAPAVVRTRWRRRFLRHYLEMVVAMVVGMVALAMPEYAVVEALGWSAAADRADLAVMVMATNMAVAMAGWMRFRGHAWAPIAEMAAAMYLPFVVLLGPLWLGAISEDPLFLAGHLLRLPAMAAAMLRRRDEYTHTHHGRSQARRASTKPRGQAGGSPIRRTVAVGDG